MDADNIGNYVTPMPSSYWPRRIRRKVRLHMADDVESESRQQSGAAARPRCPKCKGYVRLKDVFLDLPRNTMVRLNRCECGELIWEERLTLRS